MFHSFEANKNKYYENTQTKIIIRFRGSTSLDYYPELAEMDDVEIKIQTWSNPGDINGYEFKQSWSSPHY